MFHGAAQNIPQELFSGEGAVFLAEQMADEDVVVDVVQVVEQELFRGHHVLFAPVEVLLVPVDLLVRTRGTICVLGVGGRAQAKFHFFWLAKFSAEFVLILLWEDLGEVCQFLRSSY